MVGAGQRLVRGIRDRKQLQAVFLALLMILSPLAMSIPLSELTSATDSELNTRTQESNINHDSNISGALSGSDAYQNSQNQQENRLDELDFRVMSVNGEPQTDGHYKTEYGLVNKMRIRVTSDSEKIENLNLILNQIHASSGTVFETNEVGDGIYEFVNKGDPAGGLTGYQFYEIGLVNDGNPENKTLSIPINSNDDPLPSPLTGWAAYGATYIVHVNDEPYHVALMDRHTEEATGEVRAFLVFTQEDKLVQDPTLIRKAAKTALVAGRTGDEDFMQEYFLETYPNQLQELLIASDVHKWLVRIRDGSASVLGSITTSYLTGGGASAVTIGNKQVTKMTTKEATKAASKEIGREILKGLAQNKLGESAEKVIDEYEKSTRESAHAELRESIDQSKAAGQLIKNHENDAPWNYSWANTVWKGYNESIVDGVLWANIRAETMPADSPTGTLVSIGENFAAGATGAPVGKLAELMRSGELGEGYKNALSETADLRRDMHNDYLVFHESSPRLQRLAISSYDEEDVVGNTLSTDLLSPENGASGVNTNIDLRWEPANEDTTYDIYLERGDKSPETEYKQDISSTSVAASLDPSTTYYWKVIAKGNNGNTAESDVWSFTTEANDIQSPENPQPADGETGVSPGAGLGWDRVNDGATYTVYLEKGDQSPEKFKEDLSKTSVSPELEPSTTYYWKVVAKKDSQTVESPVWSFSTESSSSSGDFVAKNPADGAQDIGFSTTLRWEAPEWSRYTEYDVYLDTDSEFSEDDIVHNLGNEADVDEIEPGTTYYWQVVATDDDRRKESPVWSFTTAENTGTITLTDLSVESVTVDGATQADETTSVDLSYYITAEEISSESGGEVDVRVVHQESGVVLGTEDIDTDSEGHEDEVELELDSDEALFKRPGTHELKVIAKHHTSGDKVTKTVEANVELEKPSDEILALPERPTTDDEVTLKSSHLSDADSPSWHVYYEDPYDEVVYNQISDEISFDPDRTDSVEYSLTGSSDTVLYDEDIYIGDDDYLEPDMDVESLSVSDTVTEGEQVNPSIKLTNDGGFSAHYVLRWKVDGKIVATETDDVYHVDRDDSDPHVDNPDAKFTLQPGTHEITAVVIDSRNNKITRSETVTVRENAPPDGPSNPSPGDGSTGVTPDTPLSWSGGDSNGDSVTYSVFLEKGSSNPTNRVGNDLSSTSFDSSSLEKATTYYWQVVAKDEHGATTQGPVWSFTTEREIQGPNAQLSVTPSSPSVGDSVTLDASDSVSEAGGTSYTWDTVESPSGASPNLPSGASGTVTLSELGVYEFEVTVSDDQGSDSATIRVDASDSGDPGALVQEGFETDLDTPGLISNSQAWDLQGGPCCSNPSPRLATWDEDTLNTAPNTQEPTDYTSDYYENIGGNFMIQQSGGYGNFFSAFTFSSYSENYPEAPYKPSRLSLRVGGNDHASGFNSQGEIELRDTDGDSLIRFEFPTSDGDGPLRVNGETVEPDRTNGLYKVVLTEIDWQDKTFSIEIYRQTETGYESDPVFKRDGLSFASSNTANLDTIWMHADAATDVYIDELRIGGDPSIGDGDDTIGGDSPEDFEDGDLTDDPSWTVRSGSPAVQSSVVHGGEYAAFLNGSDGEHDEISTSLDRPVEVNESVSMWVYITRGAGHNRPAIRLRNDGDTKSMTLGFAAGRSLRLNGGNIGWFDFGSYEAGAWQQVIFTRVSETEEKVTVKNADGERIASVEPGDYTSLNLSQIWISTGYDSSSPANIYVDDVRFNAPGDDNVTIRGEATAAQPGENVTITFTGENNRSSAGGYIVNITSIPEGFSIVDQSSDGGTWNADETKWLFQTIDAGASKSPSITLAVPEDASGSYTVDADILDADAVRDSTSVEFSTCVSIAEAIDENDDREIGDFEILEAIELWRTNGEISRACVETIDDFEILGLIETWRDNDRIGENPTAVPNVPYSFSESRSVTLGASDRTAPDSSIKLTSWLTESVPGVLTDRVYEPTAGLDTSVAYMR